MKLNRQRAKSGFTTIELVLVFVLFIILTSFTAPSLLNLRNQTSLSTAISTLINELRQEQYAAMVEGVEKTVIFGTDSYQLDGFTVSLDPNLQFGNVTFPDQQIVFASKSGEIKNFVSGQNTVIIHNLSTNKAKIINFNRLGTVIEVL